jgi:multimeric flavodoxin WrbA
MAKVLVLYHSQQHGNVERMAKALAKGAQDAGAKVTAVNVNNSRYDIKDYRQYDAVAVGSPDYFSYIAGTLKTFLDDWYLAKLDNPTGLTDKPLALFMSYKEAGRARQPLEMLFSRLGEQVGSIVDCDGEPDEWVDYACWDLGRKLAEAAHH